MLLCEPVLRIPVRRAKERALRIASFSLSLVFGQGGSPFNVQSQALPNIRFFFATAEIITQHAGQVNRGPRIHLSVFLSFLASIKS